MSTHWGGMPSVLVLVLLVWGGSVAVIIALVHSAQRGERARRRPPSPERTAQERFARGEIDADELVRQLNVMRKLGA